MFKMNYGDIYAYTACPFCLVVPDSQSQSLECNVVKQKINIQGDIFDEDIPSYFNPTQIMTHGPISHDQ